MKLLIKDVKGLQLPKQAHPGEDGAFDIFATTPPNIVGEQITRPIDKGTLWKSICYIEYGTSLFCAPETARDIRGLLETYHVELFPRSSVSKYNLILANSVATIDAGYRAEILLRFKYLFQPEELISIQEAGGTRIYGVLSPDKIYNKGERICQLKIRKDVPLEIMLTTQLPNSQRGLGGFGSSNK